MNEHGVPVYVRDGDRAFLGRFRAKDLEELVNQVRRWGCIVPSGDMKTAAVGQFFLDQTAAGLEVGFEIFVGVRVKTSTGSYVVGRGA